MSVEGNGTTLVQIVVGRAEATVMAEGMEGDGQRHGMGNLHGESCFNSQGCFGKAGH